MSKLSYAALIAALLSAPALADHGGAAGDAATSGPIVGTSARTMGKGRAAVALDLAVAYPQQRGDAALTALAAAHVHAHDQRRGETWSLGFAYGLTDDLTVSASLPYVRRVDIREGTHSHSGGAAHNGVAARGTAAGFGDAEVTARWCFTGERHHGWEAALIGGVKLPTGETGRIDAFGERFETEHQPGTGSVDPIVGLAATRSLPRGSFDASVRYTVATRGSQDTRLGDRVKAAMGLSWRLAGGAMDYHHRHAPPPVTLDGSLELSGEREGRQRIGGAADANSGGKALYLSPGLRLGLKRWSLTAGASVPVAQDIRASHPDNRWRLRLGLGRAL